MAKPALEIRRGLIKVRIWQRRSKNGVRDSLSVVRLFRNGDQWKESTRLGCDDIPLVRLVLDEAHTWMLTDIRVRQSIANRDRLLITPQATRTLYRALFFVCSERDADIAFSFRQFGVRPRHQSSVGQRIETHSWK